MKTFPLYLVGFFCASSNRENVISSLKNCIFVTKIGDQLAFYEIGFHFFLLSEAGRMRVQLQSQWSPLFFPLLFRLCFEWSLSTKLINIIVQSHLFSLAELPAEIQTG